MHNNRKKIELKFSKPKNLQKQWAVFTIRNEGHHALRFKNKRKIKFQWKSDKTLIISYMETNLTFDLSKSLTFFLVVTFHIKLQIHVT